MRICLLSLMCMKKKKSILKQSGVVLGMSAYMVLMLIGFQNCSGGQGFSAREFSLTETQGAASVAVNDDPSQVPNNNGTQLDKTGTARLTWDANQEIDLKEYRIYYGTDAADLKNMVNKIGLTATPGSPELTLTGLTKGVTYYFAVTAVNETGDESDRSEVMSKTP